MLEGDAFFSSTFAPVAMVDNFLPLAADVDGADTATDTITGFDEVAEVEFFDEVPPTPLTSGAFLLADLAAATGFLPSK